MNLDKNYPLVSVITVTYNAKEFLDRTISSVLEQDYKNIQYIIIDGGSSDGTVEIIKKYEKYLDCWISEDDNGIFDAMNKGIDRSSGEWINFMNAGDTFCNKSIVSLVMSKREQGTDIICGDNYLLNKDGDRLYSKAPMFKDVWNSTIPCNHQSMFVKRKLLLDFPFNLTYDVAADYDFVIKQYKNNAIFQFMDFPICNFLTDGISQSNSVKLQIESLMVMSKYAPQLTKDISKNIHLSRLSSLLEDESKYETFSQQVNRLFSDVKYLESENKKIIIYGAGSIGRMIANSVAGTVECFVDRGDIGKTVDNFSVIKPEKLKDKVYDYILISLLGREGEIRDYLVDEMYVSKEKIYRLSI